MYMQNQAQSVYGNPYIYSNPNYGYGYGGYVAPNGQTPWSAGAMPYAYNGGNFNRRYVAPRVIYNNHRRWWR